MNTLNFVLKEGTNIYLEKGQAMEAPMKKRKNDISSENTWELSQRVVELLATGAFRLATEGEKTNTPTLPTPAQAQISPMPIKRGRIPFGEKLSASGLEINENEMTLIKRIQELAKEGWSSAKIAKLLNAEDHVTKRAGKWTRTAVWRILQRHK